MPVAKKYFKLPIQQHAVQYIFIYIGLGAVWLVLSTLITQIAFTNPQWQKQIVIANDILFFGASCAFFAFVAITWQEKTNVGLQLSSKAQKQHRWRYIFSLFAMCCFVPLAGWLAFKIQAPLVEEKTFLNLSGVAELKAKQIEQWLTDRRNAGVALTANDGFIRRAAEWQKTRKNAEEEYIRGRLESLMQAHDFDNVSLVNTKGRSLISVYGDEKQDAAVLDLLPVALLTRQVQRVSVNPRENSSPVIDFIVPLHSASGIGQAVGAIILRINPDRIIFPYLQHWPKSPTSSEILLVRQQENFIVYLSHFKNSEASGLKRVPLTSVTNPAVIAAISGKEGFTYGIDYRNKKVLAAFRPVSGTKWFLVAKVDRTEILQPVVNLAWWVAALALAICLITSLFMLLLWRKQKHLFQLEMNAQSQKIISNFYELPFIGMGILSPFSLNFLECNTTLCDMLGYSENEMKTLGWYSLTHPGDRKEEELKFEKLIFGELNGFTREIRLIKKNTEVIYVMANAKCMRRSDQLPQHLLMTVQEITDRKQHEAEIYRLSQLYVTLSQCNQAIIRCKTESELLDSICKIAVKYGNLKMAWIGLIDIPSNSLKPAAAYGEGAEYVRELQISLSPEMHHFHEPAGLVLQSGEAMWCQDFPNDPRIAAWRDRTIRLGFVTAACLPLRSDGTVTGVFTIYANASDHFNKEARSLLEEMANDVSFALDNIKKEKARLYAEQQLHVAYKVFEKSNEGIMITNAQSEIVLTNQAFSDITGYSADDVLGKNPRILSSGHHGVDYYKEMWNEISSHGQWQGEVINRKKGGALYVLQLSINFVPDIEGGSSHYIGVLSDTTKVKESEERINWLAHFDTLTGLPNRSLLNERYTYMLAAENPGGKSIGLLFVDVDHFKNINDSLGYRAGDELLSEIAARLTASLHEKDTVSRLGGDDFVILLTDVDVKEAESIAQNLLELISRPYQIGGQELTVTASIGIALAPENSKDFDALSQCANTAMYQAKKEGRNAYKFYTPEMHAQSLRNLQLDNALRRSLDNNQLILHYQPQIALSDGRIIGAEALIRWLHPEFGLVAPDEFIGIAEQNGMIVPIGEWVLHTAARQIKEWSICGYGIQRVAINLSAIQFRQPDLIDRVMQILSEVDLDPQYIEFELTESTAMENPIEAARIMDVIHKNGMRISIDDFGTGYSSLANLKRFDVYKLKIDRTFVRDIVDDIEDRAIVLAIIQLASSLGLRTIAEGVETKEQMEFLRLHGCHEIQGYYVGKPQTAAQLEEFMLRHNFVTTTHLDNPGVTYGC